MATSPNKLHPDEPAGFVHKYNVFIQIKYSYAFNPESGKDEYIFEYQLQKRIPEAFAAFSSPDPEVIGWRTITETEPIDIMIKDGDCVVYIETIANEPNGAFPDLYWSIVKDAIMTLEDKTSLYGDLKYSDGTYPFQEIEDYKQSHPGASTCRLISFKAKLGPDYAEPEKKKHKFSYNFYLRNSSGMAEHEEDPDIKNPSS
jgi:hypothetical protein